MSAALLAVEYMTSVSEKQQASEDITLAQNQRSQETTKARTLLLSANEEARKINDTATTDAQVIITEARLKAQVGPAVHMSLASSLFTV